MTKIWNVVSTTTFESLLKVQQNLPVHFFRHYTYSSTEGSLSLSEHCKHCQFHHQHNHHNDVCFGFNCSSEDQLNEDLLIQLLSTLPLVLFLSSILIFIYTASCLPYFLFEESKLNSFLKRSLSWCVKITELINGDIMGKTYNLIYILRRIPIIVNYAYLETIALPRYYCYGMVIYSLRKCPILSGKRPFSNFWV